MALFGPVGIFDVRTIQSTRGHGSESVASFPHGGFADLSGKRNGHRRVDAYRTPTHQATLERTEMGRVLNQPVASGHVSVETIDDEIQRIDQQLAVLPASQLRSIIEANDDDREGKKEATNRTSRQNDQARVELKRFLAIAAVVLVAAIGLALWIGYGSVRRCSVRYGGPLALNVPDWSALTALTAPTAPSRDRKSQ